MSDQQCDELLFADWRHRDQLTWQLPSVVVAVSSALITAIFAFHVPEPTRALLLGGGATFAGILAVMPRQNIFYQTVSEDLIERARDGQVEVYPIPRRKPKGEKPLLGPIADYFTLARKALPKTGSILLLPLIFATPGFFAFLMTCDRGPGNGDLVRCNFDWWWLGSLATIGATWLFVLQSFICLKQERTQGAKQGATQEGTPEGT